MERKFFLGTIFFALFLLSGCTNNIQTDSEGKILVMTTIFPIYEFAKETGKDKINVTMLLPPGAEPHTFEPRPSDIQKMNNAHIFVYVGPALEQWAHNLIEGTENEEVIVLELLSKAELIKSTHSHEHPHEHEEEHETEHHHEHGEYDPHIWLDFDNAKKMVNAIAETLSMKDPENKEFYFKNAQEYNSKLELLHQNYLSTLSNCKKNIFLTGGHDSFSYLANKYGLEKISAYGISPDSEPTPQNLKKIVDAAREHEIKYIYFEELLSPRMAQTIAQETGAKTLILNPAGTLSKEQFQQGKTFISLMEENLSNLKTGLECE
jgi:zinc transport system substrate-binding protein